MKFRIIYLILMLASFNGSSQPVKYTFSAGAGLLLGEDNLPAPSAAIFNGIKFNVSGQLAEAGIGAGADFYQNIYFVPLTLDIHWMPFPKRESLPFLGFKIGHSYAWKDDLPAFTRVKGGMVINPEIGIKVKSKHKTRLIATLGYKQQKGSTTFDDREVNEFQRISVSSYTYKRFYIGFGFGI